MASVSNDEKTTFTYNASGEVTSQTDAPTDVSVSAIGTDVSGGVTTSTQDSKVTTYSYNRDGSLRSRDNNDSAVPKVTYSYDEGGRTSKTDEEGSSADVTYLKMDRAGLPLTVQGADGSIVKYTYDKNGNILTQTTGNRKISYTYGTSDGNRDLVTHTETSKTGGSADISADYTYDDYGQVATMTQNSSPTALVTTYTYNEVGDVTKIRTVKGSYLMQEYQYFYDAAGNERKVTKQLRPQSLYVFGTGTSFPTVGMRVVTGNSAGTENGHFY